MGSHNYEPYPGLEYPALVNQSVNLESVGTYKEQGPVQFYNKGAVSQRSEVVLQDTSERNGDTLEIKAVQNNIEL